MRIRRLTTSKKILQLRNDFLYPELPYQLVRIEGLIGVTESLEHPLSPSTFFIKASFENITSVLKYLFFYERTAIAIETICNSYSRSSIFWTTNQPNYFHPNTSFCNSKGEWLISMEKHVPKDIDWVEQLNEFDIDFLRENRVVLVLNGVNNILESYNCDSIDEGWKKKHYLLLTHLIRYCHTVIVLDTSHSMHSMPSTIALDLIKNLRRFPTTQITSTFSHFKGRKILMYESDFSLHLAIKKRLETKKVNEKFVFISNSDEAASEFSILVNKYFRKIFIVTKKLHIKYSFKRSSAYYYYYASEEFEEYDAVIFSTALGPTIGDWNITKYGSDQSSGIRRWNVDTVKFDCCFATFSTSQVGSTTPEDVLQILGKISTPSNELHVYIDKRKFDKPDTFEGVLAEKKVLLNLECLKTNQFINMRDAIDSFSNLQIEVEVRNNRLTNDLRGNFINSLKELGAEVIMIEDEWISLTHLLPLNGMVKQLALNCFLKRHEGNHWYLGLPQELKFLLTKKRQEKLQSILQGYFGDFRITLHISIGDHQDHYEQEVHEDREVENSKLEDIDLLMSDEGYGKRFSTIHKDIVIFKEEKWLIWDGKRWVFDKNGHDGQTYRLCENLITDIKPELLSIFDRLPKKDFQDGKGKVDKIIRQLNSKQHRLSLLRHAEKYASIDEQLDSDPWLLNAQNGTINLKTGQLQPHSQADYITKILPFDYNKDATCPQWQSFLNSVVEDSNIVFLIQKAIGYCLTGIIQEQQPRVFHLLGDAVDEKSIFVNILKELFYDSRSILCLDLEGLGGQVKAWVVRFCRNDIQEFGEMGVNTIAIPFNKTFIHKDLIKRLKEELPGILSWAIEGCLLWQEEGVDNLGRGW
jgi:hypothetical protein